MTNVPVPPQSLEAEESILGAMMLAPGAVDRVSEIVAAADFYRESHARIFVACLALRDTGKPVDAITVAEELVRRGELDKVGGRKRIHELAALVPATANAGHYATIVHDQATYRGLIRVGGEIARFGWERPEAPSELVDQAMQSVFALSQNESSDVRPVSETIGETYHDIQAIHERGNPVTGLASGLTTIDDMTAGFHNGNLVVIAARPSMGKSALALGICAHVAVHDNKPAVLFTLEMSAREINERLLALLAPVDLKQLRTGKLGMDDWQRVNNAMQRLSTAPLFVDDSSFMSITDVRARVRRLKLRHPDLAVIAVDYLQLMAHGGEDNRSQQVGQISRGLKLLARETNVPVLALSQLSRAVEARHDKRPWLSDLYESGGIEADADLVLMLYRDAYYHPDDTDQHGIAEVNIAKHRNGPTGLTKLAFVERYARFSDLATV